MSNSSTEKGNEIKNIRVYDEENRKELGKKLFVFYLCFQVSN